MASQINDHHFPKKFSIEESKNQIINTVLIISTILGSGAFIASIISRAITWTFDYSLIFESLVIALLIGITIIRKRVSIQIKISTALFVIFLFAITDALTYGLLSTARVYLTLIPFLAILYFSLKRTVIIFLLSLTIFISIGYLHHIQYLSLPKGYEPSVYVLKMYPWIIVSITIATLGTIIFFITRLYFNSFSDLIANLEDRNKLLSEQERNYREIFNSTNEAIFIHNAEDGKIIDVNDVMLKMYGFSSKEEVTRITVNDVTASNDLYNEKRAQALIKKAENEGTQVFEWRSKKVNGEVFWSEISLQKTEIGGKGRILAVVRDISERKKLEEKIKESENYYRTLVETSHDGISLMDLEGNMLFVNSRKASMVHAQKPEYLIGTNAFTLLTPQSQQNIRELMPSLIANGYIENLEADVQRLDGTTFNAEFNVTVLKNSKGSPQYLMDTMRDITQRKEAERALKESEEKYRTLLESMNEVVILADNNHVVQYVNSQFTKTLGYEPEEIIGKVGYKMLHDPEDLIVVENANANRISKLSSSYELAFKSKKGEKFIFLVSGAPLFDALGNTIGSIGSMMDITERKKAEKELLESQQLFETLAQMSPVGIFRTRPDGYTTYVNPKWCELSGLTPEQAAGDGWLTALHPDDRNTIEEGWRQKTRTKLSSVAEYRFIQPNGEVVWVLGNARPEIDMNGTIKGYVGTITNITELKKAQQELVRQTNFISSLVNATPIPIFFKNTKAKFIGCNQAFTDFTGVSAQDIMNKTAIEVWPNQLSVQFHECDLKLLKQPKKIIYENKLTDGKGEERDVIIAKDVYYDENKKVAGIICAFIDISEQKQTAIQLENYKNHLELLVKQRTEELVAANEELTATNEELHSQREELETTLTKLQKTQNQLIQSEKMASLGVLAAGIAHEINNPLNFISGGTSALENYLAENAPEHVQNLAELIEIIKTGVKRSATIVSSLNHYSRRDDTMNSICNVQTIIDNCLLMLNNQLKGKINIEREYKNIPPIKCNEGKIHQSFLNILNNAVHSIEKEGTITISTNSSDAYVQIIFSDTGCGISPEYISRITDPFFTTKAPGKGTGLGLSITQSIIDEHKGKLEFESELGKGTKVFVYLPIH